MVYTDDLYWLVAWHKIPDECCERIFLLIDIEWQLALVACICEWRWVWVSVYVRYNLVFRSDLQFLCFADLRIPLMWKDTEYFKNKGGNICFSSSLWYAG